MSIRPVLDLVDSHGIGGHDAPEPSAPTHNLEVEQALLGVLLYDNSAFERLPSVLRGSHFHEPFHARLFDAIEAAIRKGQLAEPILLDTGFVAGDLSYQELGGLRYLADLVDRAPPAAGVKDYARQILDLSQLRQLISVGGDMIARARGMGDYAFDERPPAKAQIEQAEQKLFDLAEKGTAEGGLRPFSAVVVGAVEMAAQAYNNAGGLSGLSTGLIDVDAKMGGMHPSDLIVLAGRPSMGKTALATNIAAAVAKTYAWEPDPDAPGGRKTTAGGVVAFYSLEMSGEQLALRILAGLSGVSGDRLRKGQVEASEFGRVRDAAIELQEMPLYIDDSGGLTLPQIAARARRQKRLTGLDLVVVDYLQLIAAAGRIESKVQHITDVTMGLKALAKELDCPVIALSQLSRQVEQREDKRPQLSDLRESGSIEQDADMVWFVYREAYYLSRSEPREGTAEHLQWLADMDRLQARAELIIGKQRHGPIGTVLLGFNSDTTTFHNLPSQRFE